MLSAKMFYSPRLNLQLFPCPTKSRHSQKQYRAIRLRDSYASRVRYLLADEVGLGKTIEAGLILRELKLRGLVRRILVVAPKGLVTRWISEMRLHFNEEFQLVLPEDLKTLQRLSQEKGEGDNCQSPIPSLKPDNAWIVFNQVVCPMDSVKPLDKRRGWSQEQLAEYNKERFENLIAAGWDLVIVDEAHRLGGSTDQVARYKLGQGLAEAAPYLLLLSATPRKGKTDAFYRLISLLDPLAFLDITSISQQRIKPYIIRTEKRRAIIVDRERDKGEYAFAARRRGIERIGLPQVRGYRLAQLEQEKQAWCEQLNQAAEVNPELVPVLLIRLVS